MIKTEMNMINIKMADLEMMIDTEMLINIIKTEMKIDIMREDERYRHQERYLIILF